MLRRTRRTQGWFDKFTKILLLTRLSRNSRHKYESPAKLADMTKKAATSKLSRIWLDCIEMAKQIELLDPDYRVVLEAKKPESESCARLG